MDVRETVLAALRKRPGLENAPEGLLQDLVDDAILEVRSLTNRTADDLIPDGLIPAIKELALIKFNRDGAEGIASEGQSSGGSVTYLDELPRKLKMQIYRYRKLRL